MAEIRFFKEDRVGGRDEDISDAFCPRCAILIHTLTYRRHRQRHTGECNVTTK